MHLSAVQLDRAVGAVLASAAGDALGSQYEFGPPLTDDEPVAFGRGALGHGLGEWTDDTSMAMPILQVLAEGRRIDDAGALADVVRGWLRWMPSSPDVGAQTRAVLSGLSEGVTEEGARASARRHHEATGRSAGNGSLMRTGPVALGYLEDGAEDALAEAASRVAQLTHWEDDNVDACVLWSFAIRHAILTGRLDPAAGLAWVPEDRRGRWAAILDEATSQGAHPRDFREKNGWVVKALQAALAAVAHADGLVDALERACRGGNDTDTVAAIAGSLAGAVHGSSAVPAQWQVVLHGWPSLRATDLVRLAALAARRGKPDAEGWPTAPEMPTHPEPDTLVRHPHDDGVWLGSLRAAGRLGEDVPAVDAVVSLCRVGTEQIPSGMTNVQVWLIDRPDRNPNLDEVLLGAAQAVADLRAAGKRVFMHCLEARSRTATVAALYGVRHRGVPLPDAWADVERVLPDFAPQPFLVEAVGRVSKG